MSRQQHDQRRRKRAHAQQAEEQVPLARAAEQAARNLVARGLASRGILDIPRSRRPRRDEGTESAA